MEHDEQHGMKPEAIAREIVKQVERKKMKSRVIPGFQYKAICVLSDLFPNSWRLKLINMVYSWKVFNQLLKTSWKVLKEILQFNLDIKNFTCNRCIFQKTKLVRINFKERFERKNEELSVLNWKKNINKTVFNSLLIKFIKNCKRETFQNQKCWKSTSDILIT